MYVCRSCNNNLIVLNDDFTKCPICGTELEYTLVDEKNDLNINLDFSYVECDCGSKFPYKKLFCETCGKKHDSSDDKDLLVEARKKQFEEVLELIKSEDLYIKEFRRNISKDLIKREKMDDITTFLHIKTSELCNLMEKKLFENLTLTSDVIEKSETQEEIKNIQVYIKDLYKIYKELLIVDTPYFWKNSIERLNNGVKSLIECNKYIIYGIVSESLEEAYENKRLAQEKLDLGSEDITILSNMINIKQLQESYESIKDGEINVPLSMLLVLGDSINYSDIGKSFENLQLNTYNYFKKFLHYEFKYYETLDFSVLLMLSSYKFMSMTYFSEKKFFEKVKVVLELLEKAKSVNFDELKSFISIFISKYIYALKIINDVIQDYVTTFSNCKNEKVIVRGALKSYKDLSEGVFRDVSSLLIVCAKIIDKKEVNSEEILEWMGFPDKLDYLEKKTKLKLHKLTEGVEKILRHSEAHVDYVIDDINKVINAKNKINNINKEKREIKEIKYSYEEFYLLQVTLQETIFSILAGINIFSANNYIDLGSFLINVDREVSNITDRSVLERTLPFLGIIDIDIDEILQNEKRVFFIKGISIERTDKEILEKCISCVASIGTTESEVDIVIIQLSDLNDIEIGSVEVIVKYIKSFCEAERPYKKYYTLLSSMTSKINYLYDKKPEKIDNFGFRFIFAILTWNLELLKEMYNDDRKEFVISGKKEVLEASVIELSWSLYAINEYKDFVKDKRLLEYTYLILENLKGLLEKNISCMREQKLVSDFESNLVCKRACNEIAEIVGTEGKERSIEGVLCSKIQVNTNRVYVGRNSPCPCGSGKKYKKCCLDKQ